MEGIVFHSIKDVRKHIIQILEEELSEVMSVHIAYSREGRNPSIADLKASMDYYTGLINHHQNKISENRLDN